MSREEEIKEWLETHKFSFFDDSQGHLHYLLARNEELQRRVDVLQELARWYVEVTDCFNWVNDGFYDGGMSYSASISIGSIAVSASEELISALDAADAEEK